uniref:Uncharacterized protein n=1 Tax=Fagus sylvatica TaxID=28930 RepID=A0A2N9HV28_FAGSY
MTEIKVSRSSLGSWILEEDTGINFSATAEGGELGDEGIELDVAVDGEDLATSHPSLTSHLKSHSSPKASPPASSPTSAPEGDANAWFSSQLAWASPWHAMRTQGITMLYTDALCV